MKIPNSHPKGFTLIELLVVISIIGVLASLVATNLNEARARARDVNLKQNLAQLKTALRLYYNDYNKYPAQCGVNTIAGCGATGTTCCPVSGCPEFSAGTGCSTTYMGKLPPGLGNNTVAYYYSSTSDVYCIKGNLENTSDPDIAGSWARCNSTCSPLIGRALEKQEYAICPD